ncbi:MAG: hypothetical protein GZ094_13945 [Mariniphaga sp.]|nr:hypothetical protein [Mariniphaga sp.]
MKRFELLFVVAFILFQNCDQSETKKREIREIAVRDSFATIKQIESKKEQTRKDSIIHFEQGKVIGDIFFGIGQKEFDKKHDIFKEKCKAVIFASGDYKIYKYVIGDYKFSRIWGDYYNDKLYFVQIQGSQIHYENYKTEMKDQADAIYLVFKNKYGDANENKGIPEWHRTEKGYSYLVAYWIIGTKEIKLTVQNDGIYYYLNINISKPEISKQIADEKNTKEKESAAKATDLL